MIVVDGEFTGLDHKIHSLVSLGAVDFLSPERQFYAECRIWEGATYNEEALKINGFSIDDINNKNKMSLKDLIENFDKFLETCSVPQILIGQNPKTDIDFLKASYKKSGFFYHLGYRSIDIHSVVFMKHLQLGMDVFVEKGNYKINLDEALRFVGIRGGEPRPHNALTGAKCEAEVLNRVLYGKKLLSDFEDSDIPEYLNIKKLEYIG